METKIKINQIPITSQHEGYLWWSNNPIPVAYLKDKLIELPTTSNPFIIEGNLYDSDNQKSYSIRFVDGQHLVNCFDLKEMEGEEFIFKQYLPNRLSDNVQKLCFREYWKPKPDEFCEEMQVLKPAMTVFVGFKCKEDKL